MAEIVLFLLLSCSNWKGGSFQLIELDVLDIKIGWLGTALAHGHVPLYNYLKGETDKLEVSGGDSLSQSVLKMKIAFSTAKLQSYSSSSIAFLILLMASLIKYFLSSLWEFMAAKLAISKARA